MPSLKQVDILDKATIKYGYRLAVLSNWFRSYPHKKIENEFGLIECENAILYCIAQTSGLNATDVCHIAGRPKNSVSRAIRVLLSRGLVSRHEDVRDKRRKTLDVTEEGYRIYKVAEEAFIASERRLLGALSAEELAALDAILSKMVRDAVTWPVLR
jgi:DNA-binding MarR family transcriptional regulator